MVTGGKQLVLGAAILVVALGVLLPSLTFTVGDGAGDGLVIGLLWMVDRVLFRR